MTRRERRSRCRREEVEQKVTGRYREGLMQWIKRGNEEEERGKDKGEGEKGASYLYIC